MVALMQLFCPAFSMEKLSLCQGDEPLAAEGVKCSSCAVGAESAFKYSTAVFNLAALDLYFT